MLGHLLSLLVSPVLSRLFTQEQFGHFGLFFSLANVLAILATLGLQDAIIAARRAEEVEALQQAACQLLLATVPLLGLVAWLLISGDFLGYGSLPSWAAVLLAAEVALLSMIAVFQIRLVREKNFRGLAASHLVLGVSRPGGQVLAGVLGGGFPGLAAAELASRGAVLVLLWRACGAAFSKGWRATAFGRCLEVAGQYRAFLYYRTPSTLLFNFGTALPPTLIASAYGLGAAGLYTFMFSVIVAPIGLLQKAVGDVFLGHFVGLYQSDRAAAAGYFQRMLLMLLGVATVPAAVLWLWGAEVFAFIFGEPWREAGHLAALIAPLFLCDLAIGPVTGVLNAINRPQMKLVFDVVRVLGILGAHQLARFTGAPLSQMVQWLAWSGFISYAIYLVIMWRSVAHAARSDRTPH